MYHSGIDAFHIVPPGSKKTMSCRACGDEMEVHRNVKGPTCFGEAMSGNKTLHDSFWCPNAGKDWHNQVIALKEEIEKTASTKVAKLLQAELKQVRKTRKATKKVSDW